MNESEAGILQPTIDDLNRIKLERENAYRIRRAEEERVKLAIELNICPICSAEIINEPTEILEKPNRTWLIFSTNKKVWYERKLCSSDKSHYEKKLTHREWKRENGWYSSY